MDAQEQEFHPDEADAELEYEDYYADEYDDDDVPSARRPIMPWIVLLLAIVAIAVSVQGVRYQTEREAQNPSPTGEVSSVAADASSTPGSASEPEVFEATPIVQPSATAVIIVVPTRTDVAPTPTDAAASATVVVSGPPPPIISPSVTATAQAPLSITIISAITDVLPTATPPSLAPTIALEPSATPEDETAEEAEDSAVLLVPTVTPIPPVELASVRSVRIGGIATVDVELANPNFNVTGTSVRTVLEAQTYLLTNAEPQQSVTWCKQIGLMHLTFDFDLQLDAESEAVTVIGDVNLYDEFCEEPGELADSASFTVDELPPDESADVDESLSMDESLLKIPDLLDTTSTVDVGLRIVNLAAE